MKTADDLFISYFQLIFISYPRLLTKTAYRLYEINVNLIYFVF